MTHTESELTAIRLSVGNAKAQEIVGQIAREAVLEKHARWLEPR